MATNLPDLPLFSGPHVPRVRYERALDRLDLDAALADCAPELTPLLTALADATRNRTPARFDLDSLLATQCADWPDEVERVWQRLVGLRLDAKRPPGTLYGEPAAAFLQRGGDAVRARASLTRHLGAQPADALAWALAVDSEGARAQVREAFHGGPITRVPRVIVDAAEVDGNALNGGWVLAYAWLTRLVNTGEIAAALDAAGKRLSRPLPLQGDGTAFAFYIVETEQLRDQDVNLGPALVDGRSRLQRISPAAFARFLGRVA